MDKLVSKIHYLIIIFALFSFYQSYEEHNMEIEQLQMQVPSVRANIQRRERELEQLKQYFQDIEETKQNIELVAREIERVQQQLPSNISPAENVDLIRRLAASLNISDLNVTPRGEEEKGFYFEQVYQVRGSGTFLQFLVFLEKLQEGQRIFNVTDVSLTRSEIPERGRFQRVDAEIIIKSYRYNERHREDRGIEDIQKQFSSR